MSDSNQYLPLFTRNQLGNFLFHQSNNTFLKWIKDEKIYEPTHLKSDDGLRKHYDLVDVLKISIILYGYVDMKRVIAIMADCFHYSIEDFESLFSQENNIYRNQFKDALKKLRQDIKDRSTDPVDLHPYLLNEDA